MLSSRHVVCIVLVLVTWSPGRGQQTYCDAQCQAAQQQALVSLYTATGGPSWKATAALVHEAAGWLNTTVTATGLPGHCGWSGLPELVIDTKARFPYPSAMLVACTVGLGVTTLTLPRHNLTGRIDELNLAALATLTTLDLDGNRLTGPLGPLSTLTKLAYLDVSGNQITGSMDAWLPPLTALEYLDTSLNMMTGTIPPLGNFTVLRSFSVGVNQISGPLPPDWLSSKSIREFDAAYCRLTGTLPAVGVTPAGFDPQRFPYLGFGGDLYSDFYAGVAIRLRGNLLTGGLPVSLSLSHVAEFDASRNMLKANIKEFLLLSTAKRLELNNNALSGVLPPDFTTISGIDLNVGFNNITGSYPGRIVAPRAQILHTSGLPFTGGLSSGLYAPEITAFEARNTTLRAPATNSRGEFLPEWLKFDRNASIPIELQLVLAPDVINLRCLPVVRASVEAAPSLVDVLMDSAYFSYQYCQCLPGLLMAPAEPLNGLSRIQCVPSERKRVTAIVVYAVLGVVLLAAIVAAVPLLLHKLRALRPPGKGKPLTLVQTAIEGGAELWANCSGAMAEALKTHDAALRSRLRHHHGFEISSQSGHWQLAFHTPADAVGWCLGVQLLLQTAEWPAALQPDSTASSRSLPAVPGTSTHAFMAGPSAGQLKVDLSSQALAQRESISALFKGLRVQMGIADGISQGIKVNGATKMAQYTGEVALRSCALASAAHGGQILCGPATLEAIRGQLTELRKACIKAGAEHSSSRAASKPEASEGSSEQRPSPPQSFKLQAELRPSPASSAAGNAGQGGDERSGTSARQARGNKKSMSMRSMSFRPSKLVRDHIAPPGEGHAQALSFLDMGTMLCQADPGGAASSYSLIQLLVPGLEQRAWLLPPPKGTPTSPGYFNAPAALACPWEHSTCSPLPHVCIVFLALDGHAALKASNSPAYEVALGHYRDCVRTNLACWNGYECQEGGGEFMLAFPSAVKAAIFCLKTQEALLDVVWGLDEQALPGCAASLGDLGQLLWRGPRVRMGMFEGQPVAVVPHPASGRADYFGTLCNRAARLCHAVAHGGQIAVPLEVAQQLVTHCTGDPQALTEGGLVDGLQGPHPLQGRTGKAGHRTSSASQLALRRTSNVSLHGPSASLRMSSAGRPGPPSIKSMSIRDMGPAVLMYSNTLCVPGQSSLGPAEGAVLRAAVRPVLPTRIARLSSVPAQQLTELMVKQGSGGSGLLLPDGSMPMPPRASMGSLSLMQAAKFRTGLMEAAARHASTGPPPSLGHAGQSCSVELASLIDVVHRGRISLKGVPQPVTVMLLAPMMLSGRVYPDTLPGSKAKLMAGSRGLQCSIKLPADS